MNSAHLADTASLRTELLDLFVTYAYREGDFTLSSGQKSSYYINGKVVTLHPKGALIIGHLLLSLLPEGTNAIAGLTLGADPIVSAISVVSALGRESHPRHYYSQTSQRTWNPGLFRRSGPRSRKSCGSR